MTLHGNAWKYTKQWTNMKQHENIWKYIEIHWFICTLVYFQYFHILLNIFSCIFNIFIYVYTYFRALFNISMYLYIFVYFLWILISLLAVPGHPTPKIWVLGGGMLGEGQAKLPTLRSKVVGAFNIAYFIRLPREAMYFYILEDIGKYT